MKLRRASALAAATVAALIGLAACGSPRTIHGQRDFSFHGTRLVINDDTSDLRLVSGSGPGVRVQRWLSGTAAKPGHAS